MSKQCQELALDEYKGAPHLMQAALKASARV